jgi:hypothetical protein
VRRGDITESITRADLSLYIQNIKRTLNWTYEQMEKATGINRHILSDYGRGRHFPKDPSRVVQLIKQAAAEEQRRRRACKA